MRRLAFYAVVILSSIIITGCEKENELDSVEVRMFNNDTYSPGRVSFSHTSDFNQQSYWKIIDDNGLEELIDWNPQGNSFGITTNDNTEYSAYDYLFVSNGTYLVSLHLINTDEQVGEVQVVVIENIPYAFTLDLVFFQDENNLIGNEGSTDEIIVTDLMSARWDGTPDPYYYSVTYVSSGELSEISIDDNDIIEHDLDQLYIIRIYDIDLDSLGNQVQELVDSVSFKFDAYWFSNSYPNAFDNGVHSQNYYTSPIGEPIGINTNLIFGNDI